MVKIPKADFDQLCTSALFWYKGQLVKVLERDGDEIDILYLKNRKTLTIDYDEHEAFIPTTERIGMVNIRKSCVFICRSTARQYLISNASSNNKISTLPVPYPLERIRTVDEVKRFISSDIASAIANEYPSLPDAYANAKAWDGACAFDKQFAVCSAGGIYYKTRLVGSYDGKAIIYNSGCEHLGILLENQYEKTSRTFKTTPIRG